MNQPDFLSPRRLGLVFLGIGLALALLMLAPYSPGYGFVPVPLLWQLFSWSPAGGFGGLYFIDQGKWQHGLLILPLILLLGWFTRQRWKDPGAAGAAYPVARGSWLGFVIVVLGLLVWYGGVRVNTRYLGFAAVQLVAGGLVWWLLGWNWFKKLGPLWVILAFAWPVPMLDSTVSFKMRVYSAELATQLLQALGVAVVNRGTGLVSAASEATAWQEGTLFQVGVAGPCSGMKSLMMLLLMAVVYGYLFHRVLWHRLALFAVALPLALLANTVRITLLVLGTIWFGAPFAIGESEQNPSVYHIGAGLLVFAIVLTGLIALSALLRRDLRPWRRDRSIVVRRAAAPARAGGEPGPESDLHP